MAKDVDDLTLAQLEKEHAKLHETVLDALEDDARKLTRAMVERYYELEAALEYLGQFRSYIEQARNISPTPGAVTPPSAEPVRVHPGPAANPAEEGEKIAAQA